MFAIYTSYVTYLTFIFGTEFPGTKFTGTEFTGHRAYLMKRAYLMTEIQDHRQVHQQAKINRHTNHNGTDLTCNKTSQKQQLNRARQHKYQTPRSNCANIPNNNFQPLSQHKHNPTHMENSQNNPNSQTW